MIAVNGVLGAALSALLFSCGGHAPLLQDPANRAEAEIGRSFAVTAVSTPEAPPAPSGALAVDKAKITIQKLALGKEFLLQASLVPQQTAPSFNGLQSRVVVFRQEGKKLSMIESSKGLLIAKNYPQTLLIAEFPITEENDTSIGIDFNAGMKRLFIGSDWHSRDFGREDHDYRSLNAPISTIVAASINPNNNLEIHQLALVESQQSGTFNNTSVEVVYYLAPYLPDVDFVPTRAPRHLNQLGFFEVESRFNDESGQITYAAKNNISKPLVFAISANTPPEYKAAVKDGVLYWNKAFGKTVIQVIDAPEKVFAPSPVYNMVQWVDWDSAGFAYADAQMDPRNGEVLHQQIYFTSAWAHIGQYAIEEYLRSPVETAPKIGLRGFTSSALCDMDLNAQIGKELLAITSQTTDPVKIQKASQDLIREVVAHEVGHTLGLRHNFAGSLASNYQIKDRATLFKDYLETGSAKPDLIVSSSVMDYIFPMEAMMLGDQITKSAKAAEYDQKVIESLYLAKTYKPSEMPLFCTDSQILKYADCKPYDLGNSFVDWIRYEGHHELEVLPYNTLLRYIRAKVPLFGGQEIPVEEVSLDPKTTAARMMRDEPTLLAMLPKDGHLLSVERKYPYTNSSNTEEIRAKVVELLTADLNRNGKFDQVLIGDDEISSDQLNSKFDALLETMSKGVTVEGKSYEFSADEISIIKTSAHTYFKALPHQYAKLEVTVLGGGSLLKEMYPEFAELIEKMEGPKKAFEPSILADEFASYLAKRLKHFLLTTSAAPTVFKRNTTADWIATGTPLGPSFHEAKTELTITLPHFAYPVETRKAASKLLDANRSESPGWAYVERLGAQKAYDEMVSTALVGVTAKDSGALENYPQEVINWILEYRGIHATLGSEAPSKALNGVTKVKVITD